MATIFQQYGTKIAVRKLQVWMFERGNVLTELNSICIEVAVQQNLTSQSGKFVESFYFRGTERYNAVFSE